METELLNAARAAWGGGELVRRHWAGIPESL